MTTRRRDVRTAATVVRQMATEIEFWHDQLPGPYEHEPLTSVGVLADHLAELNSLQFRWVSAASFRATQGVDDPGYREVTAAQALTAGLLGEVVGHVSTALSASARLSVLDLSARPDGDRLRERFTRRGNLALARAHQAVTRAVATLNGHAQHLDQRYSGASLLTRDQITHAARASSALGHPAQARAGSAPVAHPSHVAARAERRTR